MAPVTSDSAGRFRRTALAVFMLALVGTTAWLFWQASRTVRLAAAAPLPAILIETADGRRTLARLAGRRTVVLLFRKACGYCVEELDALEREVDRLDGVSLYLLTLDGDFEPATAAARWPGLAGAPAVVWGRVRPTAWASTFGRPTVPAAYLFDAEGRFVRSYLGTTSIDALVGP